MLVEGNLQIRKKRCLIESCKNKISILGCKASKCAATYRNENAPDSQNTPTSPHIPPLRTRGKFDLSEPKPTGDRQGLTNMKNTTPTILHQEYALMARKNNEPKPGQKSEDRRRGTR